MTLPDLPQKNKKKEADFGIRLRHWFEKTKPFPQTIELKQTETNRFLLSNIKDNQLAFAHGVRSSTGRFVRVQGMNGESDYIWLKEFPSFFAIKYPDCVCILSPEIIEQEKKRGKSITKERAQEVSVKVIKLSTCIA